MHRRLLLFTSGANAPIDIEIEGSLSALNTKAKVATFLGIIESKLRYYTNSGNLLQVSLRGGYNVPTIQYLNNTTMTKFRDITGKVERVGQNSFRNTQLTELLLPKMKYTTEGGSSIAYNTLLTHLEFPELIYYSNQALRANSSALQVILPKLEVIKTISDTLSNEFQGLASLELLDIKKLKIYGLPSSGYGETASGLNGLKSGCIINVNIVMKTANSGSVHEAFRWAKNRYSAVVNFYNDDGTYNSTL